MARIDIKPLSVNEAYRGRRFATAELTQYKRDLGWLLPRMEVPNGPLSARYVFGLSSIGADVDNCVKAFQDAIAEHYGFDDRVIYHLDVTKVDVSRGKEFVEFELSTAAARLTSGGSV